LDSTKNGVQAQIDAAVTPLKAKETTLNNRIINAELKAEAIAAGLQDPDLLPLIDRAAVKIGDDGELVGIKEAIDAFKAKKPEYFKQTRGGNPPAPPALPDPRRGQGNPPPPNPNPPPTNVKELDPKKYGEAKNALLGDLRRAAR
jgi:hypothetical protein